MNLIFSNSTDSRTQEWILGKQWSFIHSVLNLGHRNVKTLIRIFDLDIQHFEQEPQKNQQVLKKMLKSIEKITTFISKIKMSEFYKENIYGNRVVKHCPICNFHVYKQL